MMSGRLLEKPRFEQAGVKGVFRLKDVTSSGTAFQVFGPATGKARLTTVDRLTTLDKNHSLVTVTKHCFLSYSNKITFKPVHVQNYYILLADHQLLS